MQILTKIYHEIQELWAFYTNRPQPAEIMLGEALSPFRIPVAGQSQNKLVCKTWSNYIPYGS